MDIPMNVKKPMRSSELGRVNTTTGTPQRTQSLGHPAPAARPAARPGPAPAQGPRPAPQPPPAPASGPRQAPVSAPGPVPAPAPPKRQHPPATGKVLQKGQKTSLTRLAPALEQIEVGMGWDLAPGSGGYDLDVEAFLLNAEGKVPGDDWFVFYNQPVSPDRAVRLLDPPAARGDDAAIQIQLRQLNPAVQRIAFIVTINEARAHGYNFSGVQQAYVRIVDAGGGRSARRELLRFQLTDYYSTVCSMVVGELYRYQDEWRFNPVGNGTGDDLEGLCRRYGVDV